MLWVGAPRASWPRSTVRAAMLAAGVLACSCAHRSDAGAQARLTVISNNLGELQACWDDLAAEHPGVSGSVLFAVDLRANGTVEWVDVEVDELGVPKLVACSVRRIKRWRFPEDRKRRSISFGVAFTPAQ
jgi:hypothetical protein